MSQPNPKSNRFAKVDPISSAQLIPVDIGEGRYSYAELQQRNIARNEVMDAQVAAHLHDFDRDLVNQTADCSSAHQTSAGKASYNPQDNGIVKCKLDSINAGTVTEFPQSYGGPVYQHVPGAPGKLVPESQFRPVSGINDKLHSTKLKGE